MNKRGVILILWILWMSVSAQAAERARSLVHLPKADQGIEQWVQIIEKQMDQSLVYEVSAYDADYVWSSKGFEGLTLQEALQLVFHDLISFRESDETILVRRSCKRPPLPRQDLETMTPPEVTRFPVLKTTSIVGPTVSVVPLSLPRETGLTAIVSPQKDTVQRFRKPLRHLVYSGGLTDVSASLYRGDALLFGLAALRFDYAGRYHFGLGVGTRKSIHPNVSVQLEVLQSAFVLEQSYVKLGHWWTTSLHPILNLTPAPGMDVFVMPALRLNYGNRFAHSYLECVPQFGLRIWY